MYYIIKYETLSGGGIAFTSNKLDEETAINNIKLIIEHNWEVDEAEIIGLTDDLKIDKLDTSMEYSTFDKENHRYIKHTVDHPVYYNGGDCC